MTRFTLFLPKNNLLPKNVVSQIKKIYKQLQDNVDQANREKPSLQLMATIRKKKYIINNDSCTCTLANKLKNDWQIAINSKKMLIINKIASLHFILG